jgi:hypothetical protein
MSERVTIDRLTVTLAGWPQGAADGLGGALERALRERLGSARIAPSEQPVSAVSLGVVDRPAGSDAAALAELVADRLAGWLTRGGNAENGDG